MTRFPSSWCVYVTYAKLDRTSIDDFTSFVVEKRYKQHMVNQVVWQ